MTGGTTDANASETSGAGTGGTQGTDGNGLDESGEGGDAVNDHRTYFIAESAKFDGGGDCKNANLLTVTRRLRRRLDKAGWTGFRLVDDHAWPEDFWEATFDEEGADNLYGDAHRLAVYAGHGSATELQWGRPSDHGRCLLSIPEDVRLGRLGGNNAAAVMLLTSCTLRTDTMVEVFEESAPRQLFGYHNSPFIEAGEPRRVFKRTQDGQSTKDAWLDEMEQNIAIGKHSPVVLTKGTSSQEAEQAHAATNLATGAGFIQNVGEPADAYYFEWLNNGCTPACGGCSPDLSASTASLKLPKGTQVPILDLRRPHRSAKELSQRALWLISLLQGTPTQDIQRAQLASWAQQAVAEQDITVSVLDGAIQVAYESQVDRLVVDALGVRDEAYLQPRPPTELSDELPQHARELDIAEQVRNLLLDALDRETALLGISRGTSFTLSTREVGWGESSQSPPKSIPVEYIFSVTGEFAGYPVFGAELAIGVTRLGKLSRIVLSATLATQVGEATVKRTPEEALDALARELEPRHPRHEHVVVNARVAFGWPERTTTQALVTPELLVDYVLVSARDKNPIVSRRYPARISLIEETPAVLRYASDEAPDDEGDRRHDVPTRR